MKKHFLLASMLSLCLPVLAEDNSGGSYDLTDADRELMHAAAGNYDSCLHEQADKLFATVEDVRDVADRAMKACEPVLAELDSKLAANGVAEDFRMGYIRHTKSAAVRRILPELMARKSAGPQDDAAAASEVSPKPE